MPTRRLGIILLSVFVLMALWVSSAGAGVALNDIANSWAKDSIRSLVDDGIVNGYPDGTFRPERSVTRAEFSKMMVEAFNIPASNQVRFADVAHHWARSYISALADADIIKGYPDGTFRPDKDITRAEMVTMLMRAVKLADADELSQVNWQPYSDVPKSHWAYRNVELADELGLVPAFIVDRFKPDQATTRAETAFMIQTGRGLIRVSGTISAIDPELVTVETADGSHRDLTISNQTVVSRNTAIVNDVSHVSTGDEVYAVADKFGRLAVLRAYGKVTQEDVTAKISNVTKGFLTPDQLKAIIAGDWDTVQNGLKTKLYDQMLEMGASPTEAEAVMQQDWTGLRGLARERLAQAVGQELGISKELATALLDQNWEVAQRYAQVETAQQLLGELLFGKDNS